MIHRLSLSADSQISIVKLIQNFRSHEAILKFPNERFYGGDLVPRAPSQDINTYLGSSYLPNKKFPVVFHAMFGKDDREASSPSFFNIDEVTQVKLYVGQLKEDRTFRTRLFFFFFPLRHVLELKMVFTGEQDIGVIAPYHAQCQRIRNQLDAGSGEIKVGSVEEFQGQVSRGTSLQQLGYLMRLDRNAKSSLSRQYEVAKSSCPMIFVIPLDLSPARDASMVTTCL